MCMLPLFLVVLGLGICWSFYGMWRRGRLISWSLTTGGGGAIVASFWLPWVHFAPIHVFVGGTGDLVAENAGWLLRLLRLPMAADIVEQISVLTAVPGWLLFVIIPTVDVWIRLALALTLLVGAGGILWPIIATAVSDSTQRWGGLYQAIAAIIATVGLLLNLPMIHSFGGESHVVVHLIAVLLGTSIGEGMWMSWCGLLMMIIGGFVAALSTDQLPPNGDAEAGQTATP